MKVLPMNYHKPVDKRVVVQQKLQGISNVQIARDMGVSREYIRQIARDCGLKSTTTIREEAVGRFKELVTEGKQFSEVAKQLGIGYSKAAGIANKMNRGAVAHRYDAYLRVFAPLLKRIEQGESIYSVVGKEHRLVELLRRICQRQGIVSSANSRWSNFSARNKIIEKGLKQNLSWKEMAQQLAEVETRPISTQALRLYAKKHGFLK